MAQNKIQKKELIKNLSEKLKVSKSVVFSDFRGLSVKDLTILRRDLRAAGVELKVMKKTLINIALRDAGLAADAKKLEGQIAVAVSSGDEIAAAKIIAKAAKASENLKIVGGMLGTKELSCEEVNALAKLPCKEELLAKLIAILNAPTSGLVNVLAGNLRSLVYVLKAVSEKNN